MKIYKIICDRCGEETELLLKNYYGLPKSWGVIHNENFCGKCLKIVQKVLNDAYKKELIWRNLKNDRT